MRPNLPFDNGSDAECTVFARLRQTFASDKNAIAFHSVNLSKHPSKRFAQIDFIVITLQGIFVLEVKGGAVSCSNGIWQYRDRDGTITKTQISPFNQASTALQGLRLQLNHKFGKSVRDSVCLGYGVVFADCMFGSDCIEWDKAMWCDKHSLRDFEGWFTRFISYWQQRNQNMPIHPISPTLLGEITEWIRPNFEPSFEREETDIVEAMTVVMDESQETSDIKDSVQSSLEMNNDMTSFNVFETSLVTIGNLLSIVQQQLEKYEADYQLSQISIVVSDKLWVLLEGLYQVISNNPKYKQAKLVDSFTLSRTLAFRPPSLTFIKLSDMGDFRNDVIISICDQSQRKSVIPAFIHHGRQHRIVLVLN